MFAGLSNTDYGKVIVLDHGNGWFTLYGFLDSVGVSCGDSIFKGNMIGNLNETSKPELFFQIVDDQYNRLNPFDYLPEN